MQGGDDRADAVADLEAEGHIDEDEHQRPENGPTGVAPDLRAH